MDQNVDGRRLLVDLLHEAAQLEHCLLDAYLYTACSLKSTPQELATVDGQENRRRAIQFERLRAWKRSLLLVAHEEMLHLHYVQCMIRALGEPPSFSLPERAKGSGAWVIPAWRARIAGRPVDGDAGVEVPVEPLTPAAVRRFVIYESTDAMQDDDPFGPEATELFERLHDFEVDFRFESMLFGVPDSDEREALKEGLANLYGALTPVPEVAARGLAAEAVPPLPPVEELQFQSIADLYKQGILPLYREAFDFGWVTHDNLNLSDELLDPNYAQEGLLPIGPIKREKNFTRLESAPQDLVGDPLRHYMDVDSIVDSIVDEGEGATNFDGEANAFLAKVEEIGGARAYLEALKADSATKDPTPDWLRRAEFLRESHLYRFAMVMTELTRERELAERAGVDFEPSRPPLAAEGSVALEEMARELPAQFNGCYLVLVAWLSRMYEIREWMADRPRRMAIEMLASWPLMSVAIRPFLELASFLPVDVTKLFRFEGDALPMLPVHAQQLQRLYAGEERSEEINERMDYLAVRVLSDAAAWANRQAEALAGESIDEHAKQMMGARLNELGHLDEFERQFPYRVAGGYSDRIPDLGFQNAEPDREAFEEDPTHLPALFEDALALRLRFAGRGLVQMATDPDPPSDESGCSGTHMLHAADGDRVFDKALIWQPDEDPEHSMLRGPADGLPPLGIDCTEVALTVTGAGGAVAGYVPLGVMNSSGAVQTTGLQQDLSITGLHELLALTPAEVVGPDAAIRFALRPKDGQWPFQNGYNHLVWQDGEPIDPFVLAVSAGELLFQREIYNEGRALLEMTPLQRLLSCRGPSGFDSYANIPGWVLPNLSAQEQALLADPAFPMAYLGQRGAVLAAALKSQLGAGGEDPAQAWVDEVVSLAERMRLVSVPLGTTIGWLTALLHYGHTVSGELTPGAQDNPVFTALRARTGLELQLAEESDRNAPNMRWLLGYTQGVMDTDGLSDLVYGELYVPLTVAPGTDPVSVARRWTFPAEIRDAVAGYACRFDAPFWATFDVQGDKRTTSLPDGTTITETLAGQETYSYDYTMAGPAGISDYAGSFGVSEPAGGRVTLEWRDTFRGADGPAIVSMLSTIAGAGEAMTAALEQHFGPGAT